jgi:hypothetical protein
VYEPVDVDYLSFSNGTWVTRSIYTGLQSGTGAVMFANLDADTTMEFVSGAPGPIGHGSMYALKHVSDTTWSVIWADSTIRNAPLHVNSGYLNGEFVVAGANSYNPNNDTIWSQVHAYQPSGVKNGIWFRDSASIQSFYLMDIDGDSRTNLIFAQLSHFLGHYLFDCESDTMVVGVHPRAELPEQLKLLQNCPNPFNPITTVRFHLPHRAEVALYIYNILGKEVKTLLQTQLESGKHEVQWDATTNEGGGAASGVYFYRLVVKTMEGILHTQTRKMVLIR